MPPAAASQRQRLPCRLWIMSGTSRPTPGRSSTYHPEHLPLLVPFQRHFVHQVGQLHGPHLPVAEHGLHPGRHYAARARRCLPDFPDEGPHMIDGKAIPQQKGMHGWIVEEISDVSHIHRSSPKSCARICPSQGLLFLTTADVYTASACSSVNNCIQRPPSRQRQDGQS